MKREEFVEKLMKEGFELWSTRRDPATGEECEIWGRVTYRGGVTSIGTEAQDWEEWEIYKDRAIHKFGTNRSVLGWSMCTACGQWYTERDEEYHENCEYDIVYFD